MSRRAQFVLAAMALVVGSVTVYTVVSALQGAKRTVRVAYCANVSCLPFFVAVQRGYFDDAHITVKAEESFRADAVIREGLVGGYRVDAAMGLSFASYVAAEADAPGQLRLYMPCVEDAANHASKLLVGKDADISSIDQLAGKRVGACNLSGHVLCLRLLMARASPTASEWEVTEERNDCQVQTLATAWIDAALSVEPYGTKAIHEQVADVLVEDPLRRYVCDPFPAAASCFGARFVRSKPRLAAEFAQVLLRAVKDIREDPVGALSALPEYTGVEAELMPEVGLYTWWLPGEEDVKALQRLADLLAEEKLIGSRVDVTQMLWSPEGE